MLDVKRTYKKKGNAIIIKQSVKDDVFTPKDVLDSLDTFESNIKTLVSNVGHIQQIVNQETQKIKFNEDQIPVVQEGLKELGKFEEWAMDVQRRVFLNQVEAIHDKIWTKVTAGYKKDDRLTPEQNDIQKYHQFREYICRDPVTVELVSQRAIEKFKTEGLVENPWKPK